MATRAVGSCMVVGCEEHYACRLRAKGLNVSPRLQMTRTLNWRPTVTPPPSHYANIAGERRPDGSFSPYFNPDGSPVRHRQAQREAGKIKDTVQRIRAEAAAMAPSS